MAAPDAKLTLLPLSPTLTLEAKPPFLSASVVSPELEIASKGQIVLREVTVPGGTQFLPASLNAVSADFTTAYYGGLLEGMAGWWVQRENIVTGETQNATMADNIAYADLDSAWADRENLTYG